MPIQHEVGGLPVTKKDGVERGLLRHTRNANFLLFCSQLTLMGKTDATSGNTSSLLPVYIVRAEARRNCSKRMWAFPLSLWLVLTSPLT